MKLTNSQIYIYAQNLHKAFNDLTQVLPVKINFYIQKNKNLLKELAVEIENSRKDIIYKYGNLDEKTENYVIENSENREKAVQEMNDLLELEQDVNLYTISLNQFDENLSLTIEQMDAILFMIEE